MAGVDQSGEVSPCVRARCRSRRRPSMPAEPVGGRR